MQSVIQFVAESKKTEKSQKGVNRKKGHLGSLCVKLLPYLNISEKCSFSQTTPFLLQMPPFCTPSSHCVHWPVSPHVSSSNVMAFPVTLNSNWRTLKQRTSTCPHTEAQRSDDSSLTLQWCCASIPLGTKPTTGD